MTSMSRIVVAVACALIALTADLRADEKVVETEAIGPRLRMVQIPISLDTVPFVPGVYRQDGDGPAPHGPGCTPIVKTHTDANFSGGSFIVQAGFAQNELAGASYSIPAAEFPVQLVLAEMIFATSNASQLTTTAWSVHFYDGTPLTGTEIASYASDDIVLPHIRIGPGTQGANVQFSIEANDPEQVVWMNNSGSNIISFAYRIDQHNQQTQNPCLVGPPTCCNAFPTTDVSGLSQSANNWLFGLNCGAFGCPPNGGWASFSQLSALCRPSGDWVMRLTYRSLNCAGQPGACCQANGSCQEVASQNNCNGAGQTFFAGITCLQVPGECPQPSGACCRTTGCLVETQLQCTSDGGVFRGNATTCTSTICNGACCSQTNFCSTQSLSTCASIGGQFQGFGVQCVNTNQCPTGACCKPDGSCTFGTMAACSAAGGTFQLGVACAAANCPQPSGACCLTAGGCIILEQVPCEGFGHSWRGAGTLCETPGICDSCVKGDVNGDTLRDGRDVSRFAQVYLNPGGATAAERCACDIAAPAGVEANDVPAFVNCLLTGACP